MVRPRPALERLEDRILLDAERPDLFLVSVPEPIVAVVGRTLDTTWVVGNRGTAATSAGWFDQVYLSADATLDAGDRLLGGHYHPPANSLAAGTSRTVQRQLYLSDGATGSFLLFAADATGRVDENDETNNIRAVALTLSPPPRADLVVSAATAPASVIAGQTAAVSWAVANRGEAATQATRSDRVYFSIDDILDPTDRLLDSSTSSAPLAPGAEAVVHRDIAFGVGPGNGFLIFKADDTSAESEMDETNNVRVVAITVRAPDLVVDSFTAPAVVQQGQQVSLSWTVGNAGDVPTAVSYWYDRVYWSSDATLDFGDTEVAAVVHSSQSPLAAGATYTATATLTVPVALAPGQGHLIVATDRGGYSGGSASSQPETDEANNSRAAAVTLHGPDLSVTALEAPAGATAGDTVLVRWAVSNAADWPATANNGYYSGSDLVTDALYLSRDDQRSNDDLYLGAFGSGFSPLPAGGFYQAAQSVNIPTTVATGNYYLILQADSSRTQGESDETNNSRALAIAITGRPAAPPPPAGPLPDLVVTQASAPAEALARSTINVSWVVANQGQAESSYEYDAILYSTDDTLSGDDLLLAYDYAASLPAGETITRQLTLVLPNRTGSGYLLFSADHYGYLNESNETNNVRAVAITLVAPSPANAPDLSVRGLDAPSALNPGATFTLTLEVANNGSVATTGERSLYVYLGGTNLYPSTALSVPVLAGGERRVLQATFTAPSNVTGGADLRVVVDGPGAEAEYDESNNTLSQPALFTPTRPDLVVSAASAPATLTAGQSFTVNWTVTNQGTAAPGGYRTDGVYFSLDAILDASDVSLGGQVQSYTGLPAPGASLTLQTSHILSTYLGGVGYLLFVADAGNLLPESDETNNVRAVAVQVVAPDLTIVAGQTTATAAVGGTIDLSWTVTNAGSVTAPANWYDIVYLSSDDTFDAGDVAIGSYFIDAQTPLAAGASYTTGLRTNALPARPAGTYYLLFRTDAQGTGSQPETNEGNNIAVRPINLVGPDLVVSAVAASAGPFAPGQALEVSWTVANQGGSATTSGYWYDVLYFSADDRLDAQDVALGSVYEQPGTLIPGDSYTRTQSVTLPGSLAPRAGYLLVAADRYPYSFNEFNYQPETDETNNVRAAPLTVSAPDLRVTAFAPPTTLDSGQSVQLSWTVTNAGAADALADWSDQLLLSVDPIYDSSDRQVLSQLVSAQTPLAAGASYTIDRTLTLSSLPAGQYYLLVRTDGNAAQGESDEANNIAAVAVRVRAADLVVTGLTQPASAVVGDQIDVSYTVTNRGDAPAAADWADRIVLGTSRGFDYYSTTGTLDTPQIGDQTPLLPGASYTLTRHLQLPASWSPGTSYLGVQADSSGVQAENDDGNNLAYLPIALAAPDLKITATSAPQTARQGESFTVSWTVQNAGDVPALGDWTDGVYLTSSDYTGAVSGTLLHAEAITSQTPLARGGSYTVTAEVTVPAGEAGGRRYLLFAADSASMQGETRQDNNIVAMPIDVTTADLAITATSVPARVEAGAAVTVSWTVTNVGQVAATAGWTDRVHLSLDDNLDAYYYYYDPVMVDEDASAHAPLAPGESYTVTRTFTLPSYVGDQGYRLLFVADGNHSQGEMSEANNLVAVPLLVGVPDLKVTAVDAPASAVLGGTVQVSWTVKNDSSVTARADWSDDLYLSADQTLDGNDRWLASEFISAQTPLGPGQSYTVQKDVFLPSLPPANWYLLVRADRSNNQVEENEGNNTRAVVIALAAPDLTVSDAAGPASAVAGEAVTISWTVENAGSVVAPANWTDRVYASFDDRLDPTDAQVYSELIDAQTPLAAGDGYTVVRDITLLQAAIGARYLLFVADADDVQGETNNANNTRAVPIAVHAADLIVTDVTAPLDANSGEEIEVSWTVKNIGDVTTPGHWTDNLYLSRIPGVAGGQYMGSFEFLDALAPGESVTRRQTITLPRELRGSFYTVVITDAGGAIPELNNGNNGRVDDRPVRVALSPFPNLVVSTVTPPSGAFSGQTTQVSWTVTNTGDSSTSAGFWYDLVWLSRDETLDSSDVFLGSALNASYLDAGESYTSTLSVSLPRDAEGSYRFLVHTDYYNHVYELLRDGDNRTASTATTVQLTPPPDLRISSVQAPVETFSGQPATLSWTVTNAGQGRTAESFWYDEVYLSADDRVDGGDRLLGRFAHQGELAVGASYSLTQTVTPPLELSGTYFFLVRTDASNHVFEHAFEGNNVGHDDATTVRQTPPPDLEVVGLVVAPTALASHPLTFSYTVANLGSTPTTGSWTDVFYLSATADLDRTKALRLGSRPNAGAVSVGATYSADLAPTLPDGLSGTYYLFVVADNDNTVFEADDNNTRRSDAIAVESRPADLTAAFQSAPTTAPAGGALAFSYRITNAGAGDTAVSAWEDRFYLSRDGALDGSDVLIGSRPRRGLLAAGESYTADVDFEVPFALEGAYRLLIVTDAGGSVHETDETNNGVGAALTVQRQAPDLRASVGATPAEVQAGTPLEVTWTVTNAGNGAGKASFWYDDVYLSQDGRPDGNDFYLGSWRRTNPLDPGASYTARAAFTVPAGLTGSYFVLVSADSRNLVDEAGRDGDNVAASGHAVIVTPAANPTFDLVLEGVDAPDTATSGQAMTVRWTVRNAGDALDRGWYDKVYLSLDDTFDAASDIYIGFVNQAGLAAGASYTAELTANLPAGLSGLFRVIVVVDGNGRVAEANEANNVAFDPTATLLLLRPPADLVAGTIEVPANALPGQDVTVRYTVTNAGATPVLGTWYDALYLSADETWDVNDAYLGRVLQTGQLDAGMSYTSGLTEPLPGVTPGTYHVIVRADIRNQVRESDEANNLKASLDEASVDVPALTLGEAAVGHLAAGGSAWYRVEVGAGEALLVTLDGATDAANELYVRYGAMPTRGEFDVAYSRPLEPDQRALVSETRAGTYYVLVHADGVGGAYSVEAKTVRFSVFDSAYGKGGTAGRRTIEINGAKFGGIL